MGLYYGANTHKGRRARDDELVERDFYKVLDGHGSAGIVPVFFGDDHSAAAAVTAGGSP
jgi:hypothetical protein